MVMIITATMEIIQMAEHDVIAIRTRTQEILPTVNYQEEVQDVPHHVAATVAKQNFKKTGWNNFFRS